MNPVPAQYKAPTVPQVNLIPPEVGERRLRSRRRGIGIGFLAVWAAVLVAVSFLAIQQRNSAQEAAAAEAERTVELQTTLAQYSEVDVVKAQLANAESARMYAAGLEVFWPLMLAAVDAGMPDIAQLKTLVFSLPPQGQSPADPSSPFARAPIGSFAFTAIIVDPADAKLVEDQLNTVPFFERARVTAVVLDDSVTSSGEGAVEDGPVIWVAEGTVDINYDALMFRFTPLWYGNPETTVDEDGIETTVAVNPLELYYQDYFEALIAGLPVPTYYPPLPEVERPILTPGNPPVPVPTEPAPEPAPSQEATS